jgi:hypothetical protein
LLPGSEHSVQLNTMRGAAVIAHAGSVGSVRSADFSLRHTE